MVRDTLILQNILTGFEEALHIDFKTQDVKQLKEETRESLEVSIREHIEESIYKLHIQTKYLNDSVSSLIDQIETCMKDMALLLSISMFDHKFGQTLKDVSYCGFAKDELMIILKHLMDEKLQDNRGSFMKALTESLNSVNIGEVKRLFIIMLILEDLGVVEGVALIAQYLYMGGMLVG